MKLVIALACFIAVAAASVLPNEIEPKANRHPILDMFPDPKPQNSLCTYSLPAMKKLIKKHFKGVWTLDSSNYNYWNGKQCNAFKFTFSGPTTMNYEWEFLNSPGQGACFKGMEMEKGGHTSAKFAGTFSGSGDVSACGFTEEDEENMDVTVGDYPVENWVIAGDKEFKHWALVYECLPYSPAPYDFALLLRRNKHKALPEKVRKHVAQILEKHNFNGGELQAAGDSAC